MIDVSKLSENELSELVDSLAELGYIKHDTKESKGYALNEILRRYGLSHYNENIRVGILYIADEIFNNKLKAPAKGTVGKMRTYKSRMLPDDEKVKEKYLAFLDEMAKVISKYWEEKR